MTVGPSVGLGVIMAIARGVGAAVGRPVIITMPPVGVMVGTRDGTPAKEASGMPCVRMH